jgi:phosphatidate cytidylyltransferase
MLRTRLWMGTLLILVALGILYADALFLPWCPGLLVLALAAGAVATLELVQLMPEPRPRSWLCMLGVLSLMAANWGSHVFVLGQPWIWLFATLTAFLMLTFLVEAAAFREPGGTVIRIASSFFVVAYLAGLAGWLLQLRWLPGHTGTFALLLAIFVPKMCDTGAYFAGRFLGRHKMTPILSPKKTWEGAAGGLLASMLVALGLNALAAWLGVPIFSWEVALGFGLTVGLAGMVGDLMESLIKRDSQRKDASAIMPGFGGVLDVLDSVLFAAPVAYAWFAFCLPGAK